MKTVATVNTNETMTSTELAELLGYEKKRVNQRIKEMFQEEIDGAIIVPSLDSRGYVSEYHLPEVESNMFVGRWDHTHLRKLATYWVNRKQRTAPALPQTYLAALKSLIETEERAQEAERTKAMIGSKREATLMNKASQDSKRIKKLESKLQAEGMHKSMLAAKLPDRIDTEFKSNVQTWRVLKQISLDMHCDVVKVNDARYGQVNTYHVDVIDKFIELYM